MKKILLLIIVLVFTFASLCFARVEKQYYPNGKIKTVLRYNKADQLNGPYKIYWPNGKLKEQGKYKNGALSGPIKRYKLTGALLKG